MLAGCGGGGGGDPSAAAPSVGSAGPAPVPPPVAGGETGSTTPSTPPPTDSGTSLPPAGSNGGSTGSGNTGSGSGNGGGGSTGTTPPPSAVYDAFRVSIDTRELTFRGEEGTMLGMATVVGTGSGIPTPVVYTGSVDLGTSLDRVVVEVADMQVNFKVYPKWNLPAGEYRGSLQLFACPDERCAKHFAGSPVTIPYVITITKPFTVTSAPVALTALSGATASARVAVGLPTGASSFTAATGTEWLAISNLTTTGFEVTAQPMPPGRYSARVNVTAAGRTRDVSVDYTVTGDASTVLHITPSAPNLDLSAYISGTARATLDVTLPSWTKVLEAELSYKGSTTGWLDLSKSGERSYALAASAAILAPGRYEASLLLKSGPMTTPVTVPVSFTVGAPTWRLGGNTHFALTAATRAEQLASNVTVELPNVPAQNWTASTTSDWLSVATASGTTGGAPLRVTVDRAKALALANFASHTAEVVLRAGDSRIAPTTLTFNLQKALPETHFVSPHTRLPGEGGTYIVRGRGFDSIADLSAGLLVDGAVPLQITRVNDTQINVRLAAAAAGTVDFSVPNALEATTGEPALKVVAPASFAYRAVPTAGNKGGLVYDPVRKAIYTANKTMHSVMRFAWNGSSWDVSSTSVPSVDAVALSPDGATLVATSTTTGIVLLDPATLAEQGRYGPVAVGGDTLNALPRLAITNDGRAYFQGDTWGGLAYFDLASRQFGSVTRAQGYSFYSGPWFSVSGDGSRLNIVQSASISPSPEMLYMDSADRMPKSNPAAIDFWYEAAQSLRGERFVEGTYRVWDRDFGVVGALALPGSNWYGRTPVVSPDGSRVYVLAYSSSGMTNGTDKPRVYVFDSSQRMTVTTDLPLLGYFALADYPTCNSSDYYCDTRALGTISPDGKTLFFMGNTNLVAAPIPAVLEQAAAASMQRAAVGVSMTPKLEAVRIKR
ncbi:hypothetical protein [Massilia sp. SYSU DXS3249]